MPLVERLRREPAGVWPGVSVVGEGSVSAHGDDDLRCLMDAGCGAFVGSGPCGAPVTGEAVLGQWELAMSLYRRAVIGMAGDRPIAVGFVCAAHRGRDKWLADASPATVAFVREQLDGLGLPE